MSVPLIMLLCKIVFLQETNNIANIYSSKFVAVPVLWWRQQHDLTVTPLSRTVALSVLLGSRDPDTAVRRQSNKNQ